VLCRYLFQVKRSSLHFARNKFCQPSQSVMHQPAIHPHASPIVRQRWLRQVVTIVANVLQFRSRQLLCPSPSFIQSAFIHFISYHRFQPKLFVFLVEPTPKANPSTRNIKPLPSFALHSIPFHYGLIHFSMLQSTRCPCCARCVSLRASGCHDLLFKRTCNAQTKMHASPRSEVLTSTHIQPCKPFFLTRIALSCSLLVPYNSARGLTPGGLPFALLGSQISLPFYFHLKVKMINIA